MIEPQTRTLETERLYLEEVTPELWKYILTRYSDEEIKNRMGLHRPGLVNIEKQKLIDGGITNYRISFKTYLMKDKTSGVVIGRIGYHNWQAMHHRAEIGYGMEIEEQKNKGFMREAMKAVLMDGFEYMGLHRVEAFISPDNTPSLKLVQKYGFTREGVLREHYFSGEQYCDSACYGLLVQEYNALKAGW